MIKMYRIIIKDKSSETEVRSYTVGEKGKTFLSKALSGYNIEIKELWIEDGSETISENKIHQPSS
jgi:hypothetical protein